MHLRLNRNNEANATESLRLAGVAPKVQASFPKISAPGGAG